MYFATSIVTSSEAESPLSSTTVSLKTSFESAADSGTSKEAVCLSACFHLNFRTICLFPFIGCDFSVLVAALASIEFDFSVYLYFLIITTSALEGHSVEYFQLE